MHAEPASPYVPPPLRNSMPACWRQGAAHTCRAPHGGGHRRAPGQAGGPATSAAPRSCCMPSPLPLSTTRRSAPCSLPPGSQLGLARLLRSAGARAGRPPAGRALADSCGEEGAMAAGARGGGVAGECLRRPAGRAIGTGTDDVRHKRG